MLLTTVRTGWTFHQVEKPENVSDHMYRMSLLSFFIPDNVKINDKEYSISKVKVMQMAIVHDLAECLIGDITPHCGVTDEEKYDLESNAIKKICSEIDPNISENIIGLWNEYEKQETPESIMCKDLDKFEMIQQAFDYEENEKNRGRFLQSFFDSTRGKFKTDFVINLEKNLMKKRDSIL